MKKLLRYLPFILAFVLIFGLTFQDCVQSASLTVFFQNLIDRLTHAGSGSHWWNDFGFMRRLGHTAEYLPLGLGIMFACRKPWKAGLLCLSVSLIDEVIKGFLPGREFDLVDMGYDFIGYCAGILISYIYATLAKEKKQQ